MAHNRFYKSISILGLSDHTAAGKLKGQSKSTAPQLTPKLKSALSASTPGALKAKDESVCHMEITIVFVLIAVEKATNKEAELVFFHKTHMANIFFNI